MIRTKRRVTALTVALLATASATLFAGCGAGSTHQAKTRCGATALRLSIETEGESGTTVIFLHLVNRSGSTCVASGRASFEIEQSRKRADVQHNPLSVPVRLRLSPGQRRFVSPVDWSAWCGSRRHLGVVVRFDGLAARSRFNYLPRCDQPGSASKLLPTNS